jgi:hypothetical protein
VDVTGADDEEFTVWLNNQPSAPGQLRCEGAVVKQGPRVIKTVILAEYGDQTTGEVRRRQLTVRTCPRRADGPGYDFDHPTFRWYCEDEEFDRLLTFLTTDVEQTGRYRLLDMISPTAALLDVTRDLDVDQLAEVLREQADIGEIVTHLAETIAGRQAVEGAALHQRRKLVTQLKAMAADPGTTETDMQRAMGNAYWLFGGRYVGVAARRNLIPLDQHDIPLLSADGTLHIVELKGPHIPRLVRRHRSHWMVGNDVHDAVSQAISYLRGLDELGPGIQVTHENEYGHRYDLARVFASVVIGHTMHVADANPEQVERTIRSYNAHLSRVHVITWSSLLDAAENALQFEEAAVAASGATPEPELPAATDDPWGSSSPTKVEPWEPPPTPEVDPWNDPF